MNQDKIKSKIDEANEVLRKVIDELAALEAQLDTAEKPELRHLDYGTEPDGGFRVALMFGASREMHYGGTGCVWEKLSAKGTSGRLDEEGAIIFGNLEDDCEAIAEPLRKFKTDVHCYYIESEHYPCAPIYMAGNHHSIAEVKEHILKLQRLVRTAEVEAAKQ